MVVNQQGKQLDVSKQQGIGFFASITNKTVMNNTSLGSAGTAVVSNLKLQDVSVANQASKSYIPPTLLGTLTSAVGGLLDLLLKALKLLTFGQVNLDLNLQGLLTLHKDNPSISPRVRSPAVFTAMPRSRIVKWRMFRYPA